MAAKLEFLSELRCGACELRHQGHGILEGSTFYRGVGYSINALGDGQWRWKLHSPKNGPGWNEAAPVESGDIVGTRDDAIAAAKNAIDTRPK